MSDPVVVCPICKTDITASKSTDKGVISYSCDCAGFTRPVVQIYPPAVTAAPAPKSTTKKEA